MRPRSPPINERRAPSRTRVAADRWRQELTAPDVRRPRRGHNVGVLLSVFLAVEPRVGRRLMQAALDERRAPPVRHGQQRKSSRPLESSEGAHRLQQTRDTLRLWARHATDARATFRRRRARRPRRRCPPRLAAASCAAVALKSIFVALHLDACLSMLLGARAECDGARQSDGRRRRARPRAWRHADPTPRPRNSGPSAALRKAASLIASPAVAAAAALFSASARLSRRLPPGALTGRAASSGTPSRRRGTSIAVLTNSDVAQTRRRNRQPVVQVDHPGSEVQPCPRVHQDLDTQTPVKVPYCAGVAFTSSRAGRRRWPPGSRIGKHFIQATCSAVKPPSLCRLTPAQAGPPPSRCLSPPRSAARQVRLRVLRMLVFTPLHSRTSVVHCHLSVTVCMCVCLCVEIRAFGRVPTVVTGTHASRPTRAQHRRPQTS